MCSFPNFEPVHCSMLIPTAALWPAYRFLRRQVRWSGIPISLRIFHSLSWSTQWPRVRHPGMWSQVGLRKHYANKVSGGDGIPVELFQILKDDAVKVLQSICQQIWKTQQWPQDWKKSVFIPIPKRGTAKECSNYHTVALISHTSKVMLKILQARLQ